LKQHVLFKIWLSVPVTEGFSGSLRLLLIALVIVTMGLLGWQSYGPARVLPLSPTDFHYSVGSDMVSGGNSTAELRPLEAGIQLACTIRRGYTWPYCVASVRLGNEPKGLDLTAYESLRLKVRHQGAGAAQLRLFLRDFQPGLSVADDWNSLKVDEVWFDVTDDGVVEVPLKVFRVASWWLSEHKVPLEKTDPRLDNVVMLEFSTPNDVPDGLHLIDLQSIELVGRPFREQRLVNGLLACWFVFGIASLALELHRYRGRYRQARQRLTHLQALNESLQLETRELAGKARTDPLTGALNREGLRDFLADHWNEKGAEARAISVIFADIDFFKRINDTYGHAVGDEVLREFGELLRSRIRATDCFVRWGGEEFLIVCPGAGLKQSCALAEALRQFVETAEWPANAKVTTSFGVATRVGQEDFGDLLARADKQVYEAKRCGRNRVVGAAVDH
jgi:diguanylate cyclase (GGDEF)-like protein